jgi:hypothetical protein
MTYINLGILLVLLVLLAIHIWWLIQTTRRGPWG